MNYSYTIEKLSTTAGYMRVRYESAGQATVRETFNPAQFDEPSLVALIEARASKVIAMWERAATLGDEDETTLGITLTGSKTYVEPTPPTPTAAELVEIALGNVAAARYEKESEGVVWVDGSSTFYLDTTVDSQNRFSAARIAIEGGQRADGAVWKLADISTGTPVLTFRPTTNNELITWAGLVHDHVQKCFEAEAITANKIMLGDLDADFETEFNNL